MMANANWTTTSISDATAKIMDYRGRTPKKLGMDWGNGYIPAISARNVRMGKVDFDEEFYVASDSLYRRWMTQGDMEQGDTLITTEAPLGNVAAVPDARRYILSQRTVLLRPKSDLFDKDFFTQALQAPVFQSLLNQNSSGSTALGIQRKKLEQLRIPTPPLKEQRRIASAIRGADDLIATLERLIVKKQAIKQGMMQQLLSGRTRLPGFADEWRQSTVGQEFDVQLGKRLDAAVNRGALKTCINNRGVRWGRIMLSEAIEAPLTDADIQTLKLESGDVLMCEGGEIGRSAVWRGELPEAYFLNTLHRLRSNGDLDPYLLVAYFQRWVETGELSAVVGKATLAHLTKENLVRIPVPMPGRDEQVGIAAILKDADKELGMLGSRLSKARAMKTGMMQQLLTGRTRLPVDATP